MQCPTCHEPVAVWVAFCPHCGARQGADPQPRASEPTEPAEHDEGTEALEPIAVGTGDPHDSSLTAELFGAPVDPTPAEGMAPIEDPHAGYAAAPVAVAPSAPAPPSATDHPGYGPPSRPEPEWTQWEEEEPPRRGAAPWLIGVAAALVVLTLGFVVWSMLRVTDSGEASNSPNAQTTTSPRSTPGASSPATSPGATSSASGSPSASATPATAVPAGAIACGTSGTGDAAAVYAADANTTCPFALAVGDAYRAANSNGAPASITAKSPVTNKDYNLICSGSVPTTCQADSGATVYLTRAG